MIGDWKGTVLGVFEGRAENASYVRLRSTRLSSGRAVRLPEAKKRLLRALSLVPVAVLSKARLLLKAARDRLLTWGRKGTVLDVFEGCAVHANYVRLRSSRLSSSHAVRLSEANKRRLRALSIVPVAVLSKARLLLKAARDRRLASGSSRLACSASLSACIFAECFSTLSHKEKLC
ncbi:unnamed protein product [Coccothraustes coccothraustes]